jgi:hypothetical protein
MKGIHLTLVLGLAACASSGEKAPDAGGNHAAHLNAQPWERDPYTRTSEIVIDGAVAGYLVEYQPIPDGTQVERALPTGSYRIEGKRFEPIGFVSPSGDVRRFVADGSESLGSWRLEEGLKLFFKTSSRVQLRELRPAPPPKAPAPKEGSEKGDGKGDGKKEGEAGGEKKDGPAGGK